jgi:hypothetical protein
MTDEIDSRITQELYEIDGVRARLTDLIDEGLPLPQSHYVTNALKALYSARLWLLKEPPQEDAKVIPLHYEGPAGVW